MDGDDDPGYRVLGEVFICPKAALDYTELEGGDPADELTLYVVHGLLHLLGYDDIALEDERVMREAERKHMAQLRARRHLLTISR